MCSAVLIALGVALAHAQPNPEPIAVVVSARWETPEEIPLATLRRLYMGTLTRWAGRRIERYELPTGSVARSAFASKVMGLRERELEDYWLEQALTGGAIPPREVDGTAEMRRTIADRIGSIGYVPLSELEREDATRLRVLAVRERDEALRPGDPRYPIRTPIDASPASPDSNRTRERDDEEASPAMR